MEASTKFWDTVDPELFLKNDEANPMRAATARIIETECPAMLVEIGPGTGTDYRDHFRHILGLTYRGLEGSAALSRRLIDLYGEEHFQHGTFASLTPRAAEIVYTKALLEHQPGFLWPLQQMLQAARKLVLVNWYLPPADEARLSYNEQQDVFYNRYARADVLTAVNAASWRLSRAVQVAGSTNELWVLRPAA